MGFEKDKYIMLMWMAKSKNLRVSIFLDQIIWKGSFSRFFELSTSVVLTLFFHKLK